MRTAQAMRLASTGPLDPMGRPGIHLQGRTIRAPGLKVKLAAYDLAEDLDIWPSDEICHLLHVVSGPGQRVAAHPTSHAFGSRPVVWGGLGFAPAGMPAWFRAGAGRAQVCRLSFTQAKADALFEGRAAWRFENLGAYVALRSRSALSTIQRLEMECLKPGVAHESFVDAIASALIIELCRQFASASEAGAAAASKLAPWQLRRIEDYAREAACTRPKSVADFAELCGVSASHLARCFKQTTGTTVHAYVQSIRIERAQALLAESELPLKEVAAACGFATPRYFSTAFRLAVGEAPRSYRARARAKVYRLSS